MVLTAPSSESTTSSGTLFPRLRCDRSSSNPRSAFSTCQLPATMFSDSAATRSKDFKPSFRTRMQDARVAASLLLVMFASSTSMFTGSAPSFSEKRRRESSLP